MNSLEMRVGGSESHIQLGLADLFIAAVPALQLLAQHDIIYVPQCLIYLIEGIELSIVNDIMNNPHPAILQALHAIYSAINPQYIPSVRSSISSYNPEYLKTLLKYCPEWGIHQNLSTPVQVQQTTAVVQTRIADGWTIYWNKMKEAQQKGPSGFLESLQYVAVMRSFETHPVHQQILSNYLMSVLLPSISAYYLPQLGTNEQFVLNKHTITNASNILQVVRYIATYCPQEGEYLLHLRDMVSQLVEAVRQSKIDPTLVAAVVQQADELVNPPQQTPQTPSYYPPQMITGQDRLQERSSVPVVTFLSPVKSVEVSFGNVEGYEQQSQQLQDSMHRAGQSVVQPVVIDNPVFPDIDTIQGTVEDQAPRLEMLGVAASLSRCGECHLIL